MLGTWLLGWGTEEGGTSKWAFLYSSIVDIVYIMDSGEEDLRYSTAAIVDIKTEKRNKKEI